MFGSGRIPGMTSKPVFCKPVFYGAGRGTTIETSSGPPGVTGTGRMPGPLHRFSSGPLALILESWLLESWDSGTREKSDQWSVIGDQFSVVSERWSAVG